MTNEEILKKAIEKAIKNGYTDGKFFIDYLHIDQIASRMMWGQFLFDHDFAKAFWGTEEICRDCHGSVDKENKPEGYKHCSSGWHEAYALLPWQYHLQQMVICEDPIKYLEKFI